MAERTMIETESLALVNGGRVLLRDLSLRLNAGQVLAVLGPNGRGKTTLLRTLLGLHAAATGRVRLHGHAGYVPQQAQEVFPYDVLTMVAMGRARHLRWWQTPGGKDFELARECLRMVRLQALAKRPFPELSGGERQLVCIARAMAGASPIMLLDEPAAALDLRNQDIVLNTLRRLAKEKGLVVVFTTHQPQHAQHIADQTLLMHADQDCEHGPTAEVCTDARLSRLYGLPVRVATLRTDDGREVVGALPLFN